MAAAFGRANPVGFTAWHVPAVMDRALHTWMRGLPELRTNGDLASRPGVNPPFAPFGITGDDAVGVAAAVAPAEVLAYADAVYAAAMQLIDSLDDAALDRVPDTRSHGTRLPQHQTPGLPRRGRRHVRHAGVEAARRAVLRPRARARRRDQGELAGAAFARVARG
ncbi:MAG: hypothetical protein EPO22_14895 [Dehalococcoidia bacterium]|nr:MAG: hypothetical protein EPO22_14895 [Dehalococcoidia bacterium]